MNKVTPLSIDNCLSEHVVVFLHQRISKWFNGERNPSSVCWVDLYSPQSICNNLWSLKGQNTSIPACEQVQTSPTGTGWQHHPGTTWRPSDILHAGATTPERDGAEWLSLTSGGGWGGGQEAAPCSPRCEPSAPQRLLYYYYCIVLYSDPQRTACRWSHAAHITLKTPIRNWNSFRELLSLVGEQFWWLICRKHRPWNLQTGGRQNEPETSKVFRADETGNSCAEASAEPRGRHHQMEISCAKITSASHSSCWIRAEVSMATTWRHHDRGQQTAAIHGEVNWR